jgi:putative nucleotidyltransferase with HDIG domain
MSIRDLVIQRIPDIPALPAAATRVLHLLQDPDVGVGTIMEAIEYDPVLTTEILRLANTAYFAGPRTVGTLRDAGVLFGTERILQLVLATSVFPIARQPLLGYDLPAGQLIRHSMAVAIGAEQMASLCGRPAPDHTFTAGLLSDIGKIVLGSFLEVDARPIVQLASGEGLSFEVAERQVLGIDHAEVGALLLEAWNVPRNIIDVVRWHHEPDRFPGDPYVVDLVHAAIHLSVGFGLGGGIDGLNYKPSELALSRLKADHVMLERAACNMLVGLAQIQHQLPESS